MKITSPFRPAPSLCESKDTYYLFQVFFVSSTALRALKHLLLFSFLVKREDSRCSEMTEGDTISKFLVNATFFIHLSG